MVIFTERQGIKDDFYSEEWRNYLIDTLSIRVWEPEPAEVVASDSEPGSPLPPPVALSTRTYPGSVKLVRRMNVNSKLWRGSGKGKAVDSE